MRIFFLHKNVNVLCVAVVFTILCFNFFLEKFWLPSAVYRVCFTAERYSILESGTKWHATTVQDFQEG